MKDSNSNGEGLGLSLPKLAEKGSEDTNEHPLSNLDEGRNAALIAVSIHVPEAEKASGRFLPETAKSGREGIPDAHAWYRSPGAKEEEWLDTDGTVLLELRSYGREALAPPSERTDVERRVWNFDGAAEPTEVAAGELKRRCDDLATATVVARHLPPEDGRRCFAVALAGFLLRPGRLDEETVIEILLAGWRAADAGGPEDANALMTMTWDVAEKLSSGGRVPGDSSLEEVAPGLPALLTRWRGWSAEDGAGAENAGGRQTVSGAGLGGAEGGPTHDELRDRWLAGQDSSVAFGLGSWHGFEAGYWQPVHDQEVYGSIDRVLEAAKPYGTRPTAGARSSVERLARAKMFVPDEVWDADPNILVCANGTLEVSTATLREHRPEDFALGAVPYEFDPGATAPTWQRFLETTVPEAAPFLQEFAGYCLTTDTSHELAVWLFGPPGTGKSTAIEGFKAMLGPRAGLLGLSDITRSQFALAKLPGKTLVVATEQPSDFISVTHLLNAIISGEEVRVEEKYKPAYTVVPRAKALWAMNDLPRVRDANDGLFRRVKIVSFPKLAGERDRGVKEAIKGEGAGILNWALEGLARLNERGYFEVPEGVRAATEEFRLTNDVPRMFVEEAGIVSDAEGCEVQAAKLYEAYRHYCLTYGYKAMALKTVGKEWRRLGFGERNLNGRKFFTGVRVDPHWISDQDDYPRSR